MGAFLEGYIEFFFLKVGQEWGLWGKVIPQFINAFFGRSVQGFKDSGGIIDEFIRVEVIGFRAQFFIQKRRVEN